MPAAFFTIYLERHSRVLFLFSDARSFGGVWVDEKRSGQQADSQVLIHFAITARVYIVASHFLQSLLFLVDLLHENRPEQKEWARKLANTTQ